MSDEVIEAVQPVEVPETHEAPEPETTENVAPEPPKEEPIPKGVQKRIDRAVRQKYEAEARAKMLEERLSALEIRQQPAQPAPQAHQGEPRLEDFDNFDDFRRAERTYVARIAREEALAELEQRREAEKAQAAQQQTVEKWNKQVRSAVSSIPDFEEVIANSDVPMSKTMANEIMRSDAGPSMAYYLATHPDKAEEIASMERADAIRELTRIEVKLLAQPVARKSNVPPPTEPVGVKAKAERDPDKMPVKEWLKWRNAQVQNR